MTEEKNIKICHLFPDLLDLYGDRGNILSIVMRSKWRNIKTEVIEIKSEDKITLTDVDIVLLGGGSDRNQKLVCEKLISYKLDFFRFVENGGIILAVCGGYQMLGRYLTISGEKINGLGILDIYSEQGEKREIGNVVLESDYAGKKNTVVGFENHSAKTYIKEYKPFGKVLSGYGNNGEDKTEGVVYKNVLGTNLHGPLLPKNPHITDEIIKRALSRKYGEAVTLEPLMDEFENEAHNYAVNRFLKKG